MAKSFTAKSLNPDLRNDSAKSGRESCGEWGDVNPSFFALFAFLRGKIGKIRDFFSRKGTQGTQS